MKKLIVLLVLILCGCRNSPTFTPSGKSLTDAMLGQPYLTKIEIKNGIVVIDSFHSKFDESETGLYVENCLYSPELKMKGTAGKNFNCALVKGIPVRSGIIHLTISGGLHGSMLSSSTRFEKTYSITVREK